MNPVPTTPPESSTPLGFRLRDDIQWKSTSDGNAQDRTWIASDPLTRTLFRCGQHEYQILQWTKDLATWEQIIQRFNHYYRPRCLERADMETWISRCLQAGIIRLNPKAITSTHSALKPPSSSAINQPFDFFSYPILPSKNRIAPDTIPTARNGIGSSTGTVFLRWLARLISKWMLCQVPLVNPDGWLLPLVRGTSWLYSKGAVFFWIALAILAAVLVILRFDSLLLELPSWNALRSPVTLVGFGLIFIVTRLIHELGHAIVCKRFGARCKEMGVLVSFGMVCPYVDITDAWRLQNRFARMCIAIAGIYNELIVATLAALIWVGTYPGWLHTTALQTLLVCSITTLLFNANPFMKYDGYFLLCDWLNIQNLRERSFEALDDLLGGVGSRQSLITQLGMIFYFFASSINRIVISVSVAGMVYAVARDWQLASLGLGLIILYGVCSLIMGAVSWQSNAKGSKPLGGRASRLGWIAVCLLLAWIINEPLPNRVTARGTFLVGKRQPIYALTSGRMVEMLSPEHYGAITKGSPLAILANESLERTVLELEAKLSRIQAQLTTSERVAYYSDEASGSIPLLKAQNEMARVQLEQKRFELQQLTIAAPCPGRFEPSLAPAPESPENPSDATLGLVSYRTNHRDGAWGRSKSLGRHLDRGTLLGWVVEDNTFNIECRLTEEQLAGIQLGTEVRLVLSQNRAKIWRGRVSEIASTGQNQDQSTATVDTNASSASEEKKWMQYQVRVQLEGQDLQALEAERYLSGSAEIVFVRPNRSLLQLATEFSLRNFRLR